MAPAAVFTAGNTTAAYQLRYHFGWCTRGRQSRFNSPEIGTAVGKELDEVARRGDTRACPRAFHAGSIP
jgi:REP element-mobilizing transposase RayT